MSFRGRLNVFFVFIVAVPMASVAVMLFALIGDNVEGKRAAQLAARQQAVVGLSERARRRADEAAVAVGRDARLAAALRAGDRAALRARATELLAEQDAKRIVVVRDGRRLVDVGGRTAVFPATRDLQAADGTSFGRLQVSVAGPRDFVADAAAISGVDAVVARDGRVLAATRPEVARPDLPREAGVVEVAGERLRSRMYAARESFLGSADRVWVLAPADAGLPRGSVLNSRLLAVGIVGGFFVLAFGFAMLVSRSLQRQIAQFLEAARRLGAGDFSAEVPVAGRDELAALGHEFNHMAAQLRERLEDLRTERERLQHAIRRIGEAFASNLDRVGLLRVVVETAADGTGAAAGRAVVRDEPGSALRPVAHAGADAGDLAEALRAAEARVLETGAPAVVRLEHVVALAHPLRGADADELVTGVLSVARRERPFSSPERELFAYLAAQAAVSVENVGLHETVERQAQTDDLTGLANRRRFDEALATEVERARRFGTPVGLLLLDIDDFKRVNDTHGHPQGDVVLQQVARVLRESCREIDVPARYGGEELAAVLPGTGLDGAFELAERVRAQLAALVVPMLDGPGALRVTASFGVATVPGSARDDAGLVAAADEALYRAKRGGKNRVERSAEAVS